MTAERRAAALRRIRASGTAPTEASEAALGTDPRVLERRLVADLYATRAAHALLAFVVGAWIAGLLAVNFLLFAGPHLALSMALLLAHVLTPVLVLLFLLVGLGAATRPSSSGSTLFEWSFAVAAFALVGATFSLITRAVILARSTSFAGDPAATRVAHTSNIAFDAGMIVLAFICAVLTRMGLLTYAFYMENSDDAAILKRLDPPKASEAPTPAPPPVYAAAA